jgi:hypothetical protein
VCVYLYIYVKERREGDWKVMHAFIHGRRLRFCTVDIIWEYGINWGFWRDESSGTCRLIYMDGFLHEEGMKENA